MDTQLKELIDKIKEDGVATAETQSKQIVGDAQKQAQQIIADAKKEAENIQQKAKVEADKFTAAGKAALDQAARDVLLQTQNRLQQVFAALVADEVKGTFSAAILEKAVVALMQNWQGKAVSDLALMISGPEFAELEKGLKSKLADALKKGMEIKPAEKLNAGFRIGEKDGSAFYEISAASLAQLMAARVNSAIAESIQTAAQA